MMKSTRQTKILELIVKYEIETQDELIEKLREEGFDVTQATASRDIKALKLTKTLTSKGKYRYVRQTPKENAPNHKFNAALIESIISVDSGENIVVVKTFPGLASAVAGGVDAINHGEILGCVAGDDTIAVITRTKDSAKDLVKTLEHLIRNA
ncbi:MAG: arginine repressor [Clostridia bacterium]|nr:arginine repressor [Clostridia bacterium]MBQ4327435.1 arginine repressor [Clostridia bacterium]